MKNAIHRTPCLETAQIKMLLNGPESFTPDGNFILGEAPELRNFFVCAGFNSAGIANAGGAGSLIARVDRCRRGAARFVGRGYSPLRRLHRQPQGAGRTHRRNARPALRDALAAAGTGDARPLRTSPLYDLLAARGAVFGSKNGWERANYFRPPRAAPAAHGLGRPDWLPWVIEEQRATREAVALYDQTRSPNCCCRAATRSPCCSGCAPTRWTSPSTAWSTPRCSTNGVDSSAT